MAAQAARVGGGGFAIGAYAPSEKRSAERMPTQKQVISAPMVTFKSTHLLHPLEPSSSATPVVAPTWQ